jgi:hypothetical protein
MEEELDPAQLAAEGLQRKLNEECEKLARMHGLDSIILFATWRTEKTGTRSLCAKAGNYYASYGMIQHWQIREEETERIFQRRVMTPRDTE